MEAGWLDALKLPTKTVVAIFLASVALLGFHKYDILKLTDLWDGLPLVLVIVAVLFGFLTVTSVIQALYDAQAPKRRLALWQLRRAEKRKAFDEQRAAYEAAALARIDYLSKEELRQVAECLNNNTQSFFGYVHSPSLGALGHKDLLSASGGTHNQDHFPFTWPDFVWREFLRRKEELIAKHEALVAADKPKSRRL